MTPIQPESFGVGLVEIMIVVGIIFVSLLAIGMIFARLYRRSSKEVSFVRTGFGGQKVIMNGGALVIPVLHEIIPVNMNTLRLEVRRANEQALITKDRMRVDVQAEFYVRVQPTFESIANAAQTLGRRTMEPNALKELVEGKFVDSLRAVAAEMAMEELHEQRVSFVQKVQAAVSEDILKNGLELESVSLTGLDQTNKEYFNPDNAFDAEGLTKLTQEIEERRKKRNDIEQETEVLIQTKNLDAERQRLLISRDRAYARLEQEREVEVRKAEQTTQVARERAQQKREAEQAEIAAAREVKESNILADQSVEAAAVEKAKQIALAEQDRDIALAVKSRAKSEADAEADAARAVAAQAEEAVLTSRHTEIAERDKQIELIEARKAAEQLAISVKVAAETEKAAALDRAEAIRVAAEADADKARIAAHADADAEKARAEAKQVVYDVEAEGQRAVNDAANVLSAEQIAMQIKLALIQALPEIISQSVKPISAIDGIKIVQVDGLSGANAGGSASEASAGGDGGNLADQAVAAALRYRAQAPILDNLMKDVGLDAGSLNGLASSVLLNGDGLKQGAEHAPENGRGDHNGQGRHEA
ncbi:MAG: flotillin domain-containing protein [Pseudomonadota bacterium]